MKWNFKEVLATFIKENFYKRESDSDLQTLLLNAASIIDDSPEILEITEKIINKVSEYLQKDSVLPVQ